MSGLFTSVWGVLPFQGIVYAFEPFRMVFQYLNANVAANGLLNVHTYHCALSDPTSPRRVEVFAPILSSGQNAGMYGVPVNRVPGTPHRASLPNERLEDVEVLLGMLGSCFWVCVAHFETRLCGPCWFSCGW